MFVSGTPISDLRVCKNRQTPSIMQMFIELTGGRIRSHLQPAQFRILDELRHRTRYSYREGYLRLCLRQQALREAHADLSKAYFGNGSDAQDVTSFLYHSPEQT